MLTGRYVLFVCDVLLYLLRPRPKPGSACNVMRPCAMYFRKCVLGCVFYNVLLFSVSCLSRDHCCLLCFYAVIILLLLLLLLLVVTFIFLVVVFNGSIIIIISDNVTEVIIISTINIAGCCSSDMSPNI
jgi:hypothetical protein